MDSPVGRGNNVSYTPLLVPGVLLLLRNKLPAVQLCGKAGRAAVPRGDGNEDSGGLAWQGTAGLLPTQEGSVNPHFLVQSHLILVGASCSLTSFCPSSAPCFKTITEPLPCAQLGAGQRNYSEKQDTAPALKSQEAPDNRKCW